MNVTPASHRGATIETLASPTESAIDTREAIMVLHDVSSHRSSDRFDFWREVICKEFTPLTPTATNSLVRDFSGSVDLRPLGSVNRAVLTSIPQRVAHGPHEVGDVRDGVFFVNMQLAGRCHVRTERGELDVMPGQLTVVDTTSPYWFDYDSPWQTMSYQVPHSALDMDGDRPTDIIGRPIDAGSGIGLVLASLMRSLWQLGEPFTAAESAPSRNSEELLAQSFYSTVEAAFWGSYAPRLPAPSALRSAALDYVGAHLGDPSLSVDSTARALSVSTRALHYAFSDGPSFAAHVRDRRLDGVADFLGRPDNRESVSTLAGRHGMIDASSFSRAFRRRFAMSPRDYRSAVRSGSITVDVCAHSAQNSAHCAETRHP